MTEIGEDAFSGCTGLKSITIPDSVTKIGLRAFKGCMGLTSIVVSPDNKVYDSRNNCNAILETDTNKLIAGCAATVIPDSVTEIGDYAYDGSGLTSVVVPETITKIGWDVFQDCTSLVEANIKCSLEEMRNTFEGCTALKKVTLPTAIKKIDYVFEGCDALKVINVPAKRADYYKKRLPAELHSLIVELPPVKKAKK